MSYSTQIEEEHDYVLKLVLIGESRVGKTNLLLRYCKDEFKENSESTNWRRICE